MTSYQHSPRKWTTAIKRLSGVNGLGQEHTVKFITGIVRSEDSSPRFYLVFEHSDGGNLLDFWNAFPARLTQETAIKAVFDQLMGLTKALNAAHHGAQGTQIVHGNLKPAHILWILGPGFGTLKLGGWEEKRFASHRQIYDAPDSKTISTENDMWRFGCILLQMLVWMVYGTPGLDQFKICIQDPLGNPVMFYRMTPTVRAQEDNGIRKNTFELHPAISQWVSSMEHEPLCCAGQTAMGDLLEITKVDLLVLQRRPFLAYYHDRLQTLQEKIRISKHPRYSFMLPVVLAVSYVVLELVAKQLNMHPATTMLLESSALYIITLILYVAIPLIFIERDRRQSASDLEARKSIRIDAGALKDRMQYILNGGRVQSYWATFDHSEPVIPIFNGSKEGLLVGESPKVEPSITELPAPSFQIRAVLMKISAYFKKRSHNFVEYIKGAAREFSAHERSGDHILSMSKKLVSLPLRSIQRKPWRRWMRPELKWGYRRVEWRCDCGVDLYADFPRRLGTYIDKIASSLQGPGPASSSSLSVFGAAAPSSNSYAQSSKSQAALGTSVLLSKSSKSRGKRPIGDNSSSGGEEDDKEGGADKSRNTNNTSIGLDDASTVPKYLAVCINAGGIYKVMAEIDLKRITSDAALFLEMKKQYLKKRGKWSHSTWLIRPAKIEFIEFKFWNFKNSYISVHNRPNCMPSNTDPDYDFTPRTLEPPPMPSEVFIHYLEHGEESLNASRNEWIQQLPKRLKKHESDSAGYGMHIIEGPHKWGIFVITMLVLMCTVVISTVWSVVKNDVQGGTGVGALLIACYTAFLTAWIYWRNGE